MAKMKHDECPACGSEWNAQEKKKQKCDNCGYPDVRADDLIKGGSIDDDDDDGLDYDDF